MPSSNDSMTATTIPELLKQLLEASQQKAEDSDVAAIVRSLYESTRSIVGYYLQMLIRARHGLEYGTSAVEFQQLIRSLEELRATYLPDRIAVASQAQIFIQTCDDPRVVALCQSFLKLFYETIALRQNHKVDRISEPVPRAQQVLPKNIGSVGKQTVDQMRLLAEARFATRFRDRSRSFSTPEQSAYSTQPTIVEALNRHMGDQLMTSSLIADLAQTQANLENAWEGLTQDFARLNLAFLQSQAPQGKSANIHAAAPRHPKVFLNYRVSETRMIVGRIAEAIQQRFGVGKVFVDIEGIASGSRFADVIETNLHDCDVICALIGVDWGTTLRSRSELEERDWVRFEIETALAAQKPILPLLVRPAARPEKNALPQSLWGMLYFQVAELDPGLRFHHDIEKVCQDLCALTAC